MVEVGGVKGGSGCHFLKWMNTGMCCELVVKIYRFNSCNKKTFVPDEAATRLSHFWLISNQMYFSIRETVKGIQDLQFSIKTTT